MTIATLISNCPAPVSDGTGVTNGLTWLATAEAFCMASTLVTIPNKHVIINAAEKYFFDTPNSALNNYSEFNNQLTHIKLLLTGANSIY